MIPKRNEIWTPLGYREVNDCYVGQRVMSYNLERNCMEYDTISHIETKWTTQGLMGPTRDTYQFWLTPDHEVLMYDLKQRRVYRELIDNIFCQNVNGSKRLVQMRPFEPYWRTRPIEDIEWSARIAASYTRNKLYPTYSDEIWEIIQDMSGYEAQIWTQTFFHWGILNNKRPQCSKTILMHNPWVLKMLYHSVPRSGVGTRWGNVYIGYNRWRHGFSSLHDRDAKIERLQWRADRQEQIVYNIATKNGTFLGKYLGGTYLFTCRYSE